MNKEKDPVDILLSEAFPRTGRGLGPGELTWHSTNKQMAFVFMADQVTLYFNQQQQKLAFDPELLKQVLGRELAEKEQLIEFLATNAVMLECKFQNPDYGRQIAGRFIKRLIKNWGPQQMLLVPDYGRAKPKDSMLFWRAIPCIITKQQIVFHVLPDGDTGESTQRGA